MNYLCDFDGWRFHYAPHKWGMYILWATHADKGFSVSVGRFSSVEVAEQLCVHKLKMVLQEAIDDLEGPPW